MIDPHYDLPASSQRSMDVGSIARRNAVPAAIAAAFMLYFGFLRLASPTGSGIFEQSNWIFYHTLRIGGVVMAVIALLSLAGVVINLAIDAVASLLIGMLFILTGGGMLLGGGDPIQTVINVFVGMMFLSSARGNWSYWQFVQKSGASASSGSAGSIGEARPVAGVSPIAPGEPSLPERVAQQRAEREARLESPPRDVGRVNATERDEPEIPESAPPPKTPPAEPVDDDDVTDGGFLASFADDDDTASPLR